MAKQRVPRTRNGGTWTEAKYWGSLRSALRNWARWWKPAAVALKQSRTSSGKYRCATCRKLFRRKEVEIDHIIQCGSLRRLEDVARFIQLLTPESSEAFMVLCKQCHQTKTNNERKLKEKA